VAKPKRKSLMIANSNHRPGARRSPRKSPAKKRSSSVVAPTSLTVGDVLDALVVDRHDSAWTAWPPDIFAVVGTILRKSGSYTRVVQQWPPAATGDAPPSREDWLDNINRIGKEWRTASRKKNPAPSEVLRWWGVVMANAKAGLRSVSQNDDLCCALLQLCSAADEACAGVGIPAGAGEFTDDAFEFEAMQTLILSQTLCRRVDPDRVRVLPKLHAPRSGMTFRSLTHNLALCPAEDVIPRWRMLPGGPEERRGLNLLLLPWPTTVVPRQFYAVRGHLRNMPPRFGFFGFQPDVDAAALTTKAIAAHDAATRMVGPIHGVVLPELSLTREALQKMTAEMTQQRRSFLVAGVCEPPSRGADGSASTYGRNYVAFEVPVQTSEVGIRPQEKHHRWKLDRNQILQYGCAANLSHNMEWWEYIDLARREIAFVSMNPWLTMSVLICEDLARQDPVAETIRAVGPNLVIALLMDGPQLSSRWSARYATVLADDPGCSVLTLTSIGMATMSRPPGKPASRVVGLWKDAIRPDPVEIVLPEGADAVVLTLSAENYEEFTADGRSDGGTTGYPILAGIHPVFVSKSPTAPDTQPLGSSSEKE
jgi:hypothetical protein